MHVQIFSSLSHEEWEGDVPTMDLEGIFRYFNRVDEEDVVRLEEIDYNLPSLSVNDIVRVKGFVFQVLPVGFQRFAEMEVV